MSFFTLSVNLTFFFFLKQARQPKFYQTFGSTDSIPLSV